MVDFLQAFTVWSNAGYVALAIALFLFYSPTYHKRLFWVYWPQAAFVWLVFGNSTYYHACWSDVAWCPGPSVYSLVGIRDAAEMRDVITAYQASVILSIPVNEWWFRTLDDREVGEMLYALYGSVSIVMPAYLGLFYGDGLPTEVVTIVWHAIFFGYALVKEVRARTGGIRYMVLNRDSENNNNNPPLTPYPRLTWQWCAKLAFTFALLASALVLYKEASEEWNQQDDAINQSPSDSYAAPHAPWHLMVPLACGVLLSAL